MGKVYRKKSKENKVIYEKMPTRLKHPCAYFRCPELTDKQYCPIHQRITKKQRREEQDLDYYSSKRWRRFRKMFLSAHPICATPGCGKPSAEVDHIISRSKGGTDEENNLQALCKRCHSRKTAKEGRWG